MTYEINQDGDNITGKYAHICPDEREIVCLLSMAECHDQHVAALCMRDGSDQRRGTLPMRKPYLLPALPHPFHRCDQSPSDNWNLKIRVRISGLVYLVGTYPYRARPTYWGTDH